MEERISVIIPVYKVEDYLIRCVDSVLSQTYSNLEIILVDDGSPDGCGVMCDELAQKDSRIRVLHKKNGGLSSARNAGLEIATGTYIGFVDSDDWIAPQMYEYLIGLVQKYDTLMAYTGRIDVYAKTGAQTVGLCPKEECCISSEAFIRNIFHWNQVDSAAWDKLYHRDLFREIRYPLGVRSEDVPVTYRLALLSGKVAMGNQPMYYYYHRPDSITTAAFSPAAFDFPNHMPSILQDIEKNAPALLDDARAFEIQAVAWVLQNLDTADGETRKKFHSQMLHYRKRLQQYVPFVLHSGQFSARMRGVYILTACNCYGRIMKLRRCFRH